MTTRRRSALALVTLLLLGLGTWFALDTERWAPGAGGADEAGTAGGRRARRRARSGRAGLAGEGGRERASAGAAGSESVAPPESDAGPDPAPDPRPVAKRVRGRVVDAATGEPVAGARVMLSIFDGQVGVPTGSWGSTSGADGSFEVGPDERTVRRTDRIDVRASAVGYRMEVTHAEDGIIVHLSRRDGPVPRGSLVGTVTTENGAPLSGRVQVTGADALGDYHGIWAVAGRDGTFRIDGLTEGPYRLRVGDGRGGGAPQDVTVAEGAEVRIAFVASATERDDAKRPPRAVRLTGLPKDDGLWVRLHIATAGRQYWKAPVVDGAVEFPAVQSGKWNVVLERDDVEEQWSAIEVTRGDGPFVVEVTAPPK